LGACPLRSGELVGWSGCEGFSRWGPEELEEALERSGHVYCSTCRTALVDPEEVKEHAAKGHAIYPGALVDEAFAEEAPAD
jgi:predicted HicB family RNase H-like nuclease